MLAGPQTFDQDDGAVAFTLEKARVLANTTQQWILAYEASSSTPPGTTFSAKLTNAQSVEAEYAFPLGVTAAAANAFPVLSDTLTVGQGLTLEAWKQMHFTAEELEDDAVSGNGSDPDNDRIVNIVEYALGLDPRIANREGLPRSQLIDGKLIVTYTRARNATDVAFGLKVSFDLPALVEASGLIDVFSITDNGDGTETVSLESLRNVYQDPRMFIILQVLHGQTMSPAL